MIEPNLDNSLIFREKRCFYFPIKITFKPEVSGAFTNDVTT